MSSISFDLKDRPECSITKRSYVEAVIRGLGSCMQLDSTAANSGPSAILVKLLLSIDRRESCEAALATVRDAYISFLHHPFIALPML